MQAKGDVPRQISVVVGTRPEAVKLAPVVHALRATPWASVRVVATAQHRALLDQLLAHFDLAPDCDLDCMRPEQGLSELLARMVMALDREFATHPPEMVVAQGDTATVFAAALAAFHRRIPFGHVEAGLRSGNPHSPFPEEMYRRLVAPLARVHFAPTERAAASLRSEGVDPSRVFVTGNTVVDALEWTVRGNRAVAPDLSPGERLVLVTTHRRENLGAPLRQICHAVARLATKHPDCRFLVPVHPNPAVREPIESLLRDRPRIQLVPPLEYAQFVGAMRAAALILTDSGGVQEEAPSFGVPVLVLRAETERPEAVEAGVAQLVGADPDRIVSVASAELGRRRTATSGRTNPFGDGQAAGRIVQVLAATLDVSSATTAAAP